MRGKVVPSSLHLSCVLRRGCVWGDSCELAQARLSPPPCQLHQANLLRSHPPHFALTAPSHPVTTSVNQNAEAYSHTAPRVFRFVGIISGMRKGFILRQTKGIISVIIVLFVFIL
jgi:hypothetical protein